jgi:predicted transcriptional regulator of viral defense system
MSGDATRRRLEDLLAVGALLAPQGGAAYLSAMRYWGWADGGDARAVEPPPAQPDLIHLITPKRVANMRPQLLGVRFELVLTKPQRVFGVDHISRGGLALRVTGRERTVVDMMDRTDLCGGIGAVVSALRVAWPQTDHDRLVRQVGRFGGGTVPKRLGYLVEHLDLEPAGSPLTERLHELIAPGYSVLERGAPDTGSYVRRWMVRVNSTAAALR